MSSAPDAEKPSAASWIADHISSQVGRTFVITGANSGLGLETRDSGEYHYVQGQLRRRKKQVFIRGLNKDHNHDLKGLFKGVATMASARPGPFQDFYQALLAKGLKPTMARLTLARKIAAITLTLWKKGENFDAEKLKSQAA